MRTAQTQYAMARTFYTTKKIGNAILQSGSNSLLRARFFQSAKASRVRDEFLPAVCKPEIHRIFAHRIATATPKRALRSVPVAVQLSAQRTIKSIYRMAGKERALEA